MCIGSSSSSLSCASQLIEVERILQKVFPGFIRVNVQKLSGAAPLSIQIDEKATLQDLKAAIAREEGHSLDLASGLSLSLLLGGVCLKDEVHVKESRWKCLADHGIHNGTTLGMIKQQGHCDEIRVIALQKFAGGDLFPMEIDAATTLDDVRLKIQGLPDVPGTLLSIGLVNVTASEDPSWIALASRRPLVNQGVRAGTTLTWRMERKPLSDTTNTPAMQSMSELASRSRGDLLISSLLANTGSTYQPLMTVGSDRQCVDDPQEEPQTPTRRTRPKLDRMPSACKESKSREIRAKKILKRL